MLFLPSERMRSRWGQEGGHFCFFLTLEVGVPQVSAGLMGRGG